MKVYAARRQISHQWPWQQIEPAGSALRQFGTYDFQRDKATNTFYRAYLRSYYAIGVYMAGARYGLSESLIIAEAYALRNSKNAYTYNSRAWMKKAGGTLIAEFGGERRGLRVARGIQVEKIRHFAAPATLTKTQLTGGCRHARPSLAYFRAGAKF